RRRSSALDGMDGNGNRDSRNASIGRNGEQASVIAATSAAAPYAPRLAMFEAPVPIAPSTPAAMTATKIVTPVPSKLSASTAASTAAHNAGRSCVAPNSQTRCEPPSAVAPDTAAKALAKLPAATPG